MRSWDFRRLMAVALVLTTAFVTMPLSAVDFPAARPAIGSVRAVGPVDLRGVGISQEGTLFAGDSIRSHEKGHAQVLIGTGGKIELDEKTDVSINRDRHGVLIAMNSGNLGFMAHTPLRVDVAPFEVTASDDASGNVAIMNTTTAGVRAINGKVTVRNLKTSESFVLTKGQEQLLGLKDGVHSSSLGQIAANLPQPIPAPKPVPQTPAGKSSGGGLAMDTGAWLAVIGGAAIAGIAIWGVVEAHNNHNDITALGTRIDSLTASVNADVANNAKLQAQLAALASANALSNHVTQQQLALAATVSNSQAALSALNAAGQGNSALALSLSATINQSNASLARLSALQARISAAASTISTGGNGGLTAIFNTDTQETQNTNNLINNGNTQVTQTSRTPGVTFTAPAPVGVVSSPPPPASGSSTIQS